jgi:hypothetical protein
VPCSTRQFKGASGRDVSAIGVSACRRIFQANTLTDNGASKSTPSGSEWWIAHSPIRRHADTFLLRGRESQDSMLRLNAASPLDHIQALYRLLLIRTGQRTEAEHAIRQIFLESPRKAGRESGKGDFAEFFRTALHLPAIASDPPKTDLEGWPLALHQLPEPERSAITLFYLEIFSPAALGEILGVDIHELARIICAARKSLEGGNRTSRSSVPSRI